MPALKKLKKKIPKKKKDKEDSNEVETAGVEGNVEDRGARDEGEGQEEVLGADSEIDLLGSYGFTGCGLGSEVEMGLSDAEDEGARDESKLTTTDESMGVVFSDDESDVELRPMLNSFEHGAAEDSEASLICLGEVLQRFFYLRLSTIMHSTHLPP